MLQGNAQPLQELGGQALVPDMMYGTLDIFNPHNAKLTSAAAAGQLSPRQHCTMSVTLQFNMACQTNIPDSGSRFVEGQHSGIIVFALLQLCHTEAVLD